MPVYTCLAAEVASTKGSETILNKLKARACIFEKRLVFRIELFGEKWRLEPKTITITNNIAVLCKNKMCCKAQWRKKDAR